MDMVYRLYTENTGRKEIAELVSKYFVGFTMLDATGYYKGKAEKSIVVELMASDRQSHVVRFLAKVIAQRNNHECVLVTDSQVTGSYVDGH